MTYEKTDEIRAFLQEKRYLQNVSSQTIVLYESCFKAFAGATDSIEVVKERVVALRERGVSPVTVNTYLRHIKCFYLWQGKEWKIPWLKEETKILETLSADHVSSLIRYKAVGTNLLRAHMVALVLLDSGLRISEALGLGKADVDFDQLTMRVDGKGGKERLVPMSLELRRMLFRWQQGQSANLMFATRTGSKLTVRNFQRDFKQLCKKLSITGVRCSPHTLRHTFAVNYLRKGGNLEFLRRILGHSSILTTQKYLRSLGVEDLQAVHNGLSLLGRT